jgi:hypothetical protein
LSAKDERQVVHKTGNEAILRMAGYSKHIEAGKTNKTDVETTLITTLYLLGMMEIVSLGQEPSMYKKSRRVTRKQVNIFAGRLSLRHGRTNIYRAGKLKS